jgi:hypothetical protein
LGAGVLVLAALPLLALALRGRPESAPPPLPPDVRFTDVTAQSGIRLVHRNGASGRKLLPETMGSGVAVIDFDDDGKPDLFFVNSCPWPGEEKGPPPTPALYRNLGGGKFQDVTREAGLAVTLYGMGATAGDYDNDGFPDLFVTGVGGNRLFRNERAPPGKGVNGRWFRDVTADAGVGGPGGWPAGGDSAFLSRKAPLCWSTSAAFLDYDGDGRLDLFVCNYLTWSPAADLEQGFRLGTGERAYGPPRAFDGAHCFLYHNRGDGTFEDVSRAAGVEVFTRTGRLPLGKSLGVIVCDADEDGWPDVVVANDTVRNFFFHNVPGPGGTRRFEEVGEATGVAYAGRQARGAMGVDWGPGYRPGKNALLIGNFADEPDTLLVLQHPSELQFVDLAWAEGIAGPSRDLLKFGVFFFDYDLDGRLDLLTCNGHLEPAIARAVPGQSYAQPPQLFRNTGGQGGAFEPVTSEEVGPDLFRPLVGRGCAYLDADGDGRPDVVLTANGGPARLLRNEGGPRRHWLRLRLRGDGQRCSTSALGARVVLEAGGRRQVREVTGSRGYLSQSELVLTFGLGDDTTVDKITIYWPGRHAGPPQVLTGLEVDREHQVVQGAAR